MLARSLSSPGNKFQDVGPAMEKVPDDHMA